MTRRANQREASFSRPVACIIKQRTNTAAQIQTAVTNSYYKSSITAFWYYRAEKAAATKLAMHNGSHAAWRGVLSQINRAAGSASPQRWGSGGDAGQHRGAAGPRFQLSGVVGLETRGQMRPPRDRERKKPLASIQRERAQIQSDHHCSAFVFLLQRRTVNW